VCVSPSSPAERPLGVMTIVAGTPPTETDCVGIVASVVLIGPSRLCANRLPFAPYSEIWSTTAVATGTVTVIVQLTPLAPVVQSELDAIVTDVGLGVGFGVTPLTVYTAIVIVDVLGEM